MNKQTPITALPVSEIQSWPLADTYLSDHNPRGEVAEGDEGIAELAQTIIASGLIQNLSGLLDANGKVGIVAGGRRWRALQIAVLERPELAFIPINITDDLETALSWAMLENKFRAKLDKTDEIRAYGESRKSGLSVPQIAKAYCVTEAHVRRRVALSDLPAPVLDALKDGKISLGDAKAFARCSDADKVLAVFEQIIESHWWSEHEIKCALEEGKLDADCRMMHYVGLDAYKEAGGTLETNLFDEDATVNDVKTLNELFAEKLNAEAAQAQQDEHLAWVEVFDGDYVYLSDYAAERGYTRLERIAGTLSEEQQVQYDILADKMVWQLTDEEKAEKAPLQEIIDGDFSEEQRALMGAIVYVGRSGEVTTHLGLVREDDIATAIDAGIIDAEQETSVTLDDTATETAKPTYSQKFTDDLTAIRLAALQTALLEKPELVLDLLAFGLSKSQSYYSCNDIMAVGFSNQRNKPEGGDEGFTLSTRLGGQMSEEEEAAYMDAPRPEYESAVAEFEAFRSQGKKARNAQITESFSRSLKSLDGTLMAMIEADTGAKMRSIWTPNAKNCFKRMNADQLNELYMSLFDLEADSTKYKSFAKAKKGAKADILSNLFNASQDDEQNRVTKEQRALIDAWTPES